MDLIRIACNNVIQSKKFLQMATAYDSPFLKDYKKTHQRYLNIYKELTGEDFKF